VFWELCRMRGAQIKRFSRPERKRQRALCPIHTTGVENPVPAGALSLDGFWEGAPVGLATASATVAARDEPFAAPAYLFQGRRTLPDHDPGAESNQQEIDQPDQGGPDADGDQAVVGADVARWIERWLGCFLGHFGNLGQAGRNFCEADHIRRVFFTAWSGTARYCRDW
jgi:hypothetical protein